VALLIGPNPRRLLEGALPGRLVAVPPTLWG
jgi:hypothetical protein